MAVLQALPVRQEEEEKEFGGDRYLLRICAALGIQMSRPGKFADAIPFTAHDATAGAENELLAAVIGSQADVDLPLVIGGSNYFKNILRRVKAGEVPQKALHDLEKYLEENEERIWENSWVRFPRQVLSPFASGVVDRDLLADKREPAGPRRSDAAQFIFHRAGEEFLRVPVSYLLKLALAEAIGAEPEPDPLVKKTAVEALSHFSNDNTSPETFSFYPVGLRPGPGMGRALARETSLRFLLTQILTHYANQKFGLLARGQKAVIYFAPHPPVHQQALNEIISDSFYRELFMSPCLSGWDRGEAKHQYMILCHQVLSRSQLNATAKLKEAGIITRNLVVLPTLSSTSLANNGTHVSLGSRKLTALLQEGSAEFRAEDEKYLGDLAIKICEHFLPLFVGTYSAAPYRLDFWDFHPERALGFLPHELDYTHVRMIWRRWKKKAALKFFGHPVTPFGPKWMDRTISRILQLRGDFVPDFRLIDYPVALMSTPESPALDGRLGNDKALKKDLSDLGIFDSHMSLYLLYRMRQFATHGFSGFEGRHYSLFFDLLEDMGEATSLQALITAMAFRYILNGEVTHALIPDDPTLESERRQIFFGAAIGIPNFYVRKETPNCFLGRILPRVERTRLSRRYGGYVRVPNREYRKALLRILREDAADLIERMDLQETLKNLEQRIEDPEAAALGKITAGILQEAGADDPLDLSGAQFNTAAERYYRHTLRRRHMEQALHILEEELQRLDAHALCDDGCALKRALREVLGGRSAAEFLARIRKDVLQDMASAKTLRKLIHLILLTTHSTGQQLSPDREGGRP